MKKLFEEALRAELKAMVMCSQLLCVPPAPGIRWLWTTVV